MTSTTPTASGRLRRLVPAALFAATVALGGSTIADPAVAAAAPKWDQAAFDDCVSWVGVLFDVETPEYIDAVRRCCEGTGGVWVDTAEDTGCNPPADTDVERPLPPRVAPSAETTAPFSR